MNNTKSTKRALLLSIMAMLLCVVLLVGTTFAWFTDSASTAVNTIQAGTLDVALEMKDAQGNWVTAEGETLSFVKAADAPANEQILWEPGCTYELPAVKVVNKGNLALKYKVIISAASGDMALANVLDVKLNGQFTGNTLADALFTTDSDGFAHGEIGANSETAELKIALHMQESAGNEYQGKYIDNIAITVVATQDTVEYDSFNNQYDKYAQYGERTVKNEAPVVGTNGTYGLVDSGRDNINTKNVTYSIPAGNYDGGFYAQHFGINSTFDGNGSTFKSFQLNCGYVPTTEASTLVVSNLNVNGDLIITASSNNVVIYNCTAKHISVLGVKNDITVTIDGCKITGTPIANVVGNNKYGVYITRPVAEGTAKVSIINSELSNIKGHAIAVNSSGATCDFTITGNKFTNYGLYGEANRAAFKIWGDGVLAPTSNVGGNLNEQATVLANAIKANNTFNTGNNCVVAEFYGATLGLN